MKYLKKSVKVNYLNIYSCNLFILKKNVFGVARNVIRNQIVHNVLILILKIKLEIIKINADVQMGTTIL